MSQTPVGPKRRSPPPRWVKVFVIIFIVLVLLVVILHLTGINLGCPPPGARHVPPGCLEAPPSGDTGNTSFRALTAKLTVEYGVQRT